MAVINREKTLSSSFIRSSNGELGRRLSASRLFRSPQPMLLPPMFLNRYTRYTLAINEDRWIRLSTTRNWTALKTRTNPTTDMEQFTKSIAPTARLPTLVRLAKTFIWDWLNTFEPQEMVIPTITLLYIIDWDSAQCLTYSANCFQRLTLESWCTNLEQTPLDRSQQLPAYKRLIHGGNESGKWTFNRPT